MAKLWFQRSNGEEVFIADCATGKEVSVEVHKYLDKVNPSFKSYYTRVWEENGRVMLDVGSWSEFFAWEGKINDYFGSGEDIKSSYK